MAKAKKTKKVVKKATVAKKTAKKAVKTAPKKKTATPAKKKTAKPAPKKAAAAQKSGKKAAAPTPKKSTKSGAVSHLVSPLDDRVLIRLVVAERTTPGGLILLESSAETGNLKGDVVAVGRGHLDPKGRLRPLELRVGDRVVFTQYSGSKVALMDEELVILRESEILGVLET